MFFPSDGVSEERLSVRLVTLTLVVTALRRFLRLFLLLSLEVLEGALATAATLGLLVFLAFAAGFDSCNLVELLFLFFSLSQRVRSGSGLRASVKVTDTVQEEG